MADSTTTTAPSVGFRAPGIDGMRALAALAVFVCHLAPYWGIRDSLPHLVGALTELGAHGVDLFIVISGFCLYLPVARGKTFVLPIYAIRRVTRILPTYYVALSLCTVIALWPGLLGPIAAGTPSLGDIVGYFTFTQVYSPDALGAINGSYWTIALEVHLYLVFPALIILAARRRGWAILIVSTALLSVAWGLLARGDGSIIGSPFLLPERLVEFCVGMLAAHVVASGWRPPRRVLWAGALGGLAMACAWSTYVPTVGGALFWSLPSACALVLACDVWPDGSDTARVAARFGLSSYSFYLIHQPVLLLTGPLALGLTSNPVLLTALGLSVGLGFTWALAHVMYRLVEQPTTQWGARKAAAAQASQI